MWRALRHTPEFNWVITLRRVPLMLPRDLKSATIAVNSCCQSESLYMDETRNLPVRDSLPIPPRRKGGSGFSPWLIRVPLLGFTAIMLLAFLAVFYIAFHQYQYDGLIYPGVSAYGVSLSGLNRDQAADVLEKRYTYGSDAVFTFRDGTKSWQMSAQDLGVAFDVQKTIDLAYQIGRTGGFIENLSTQTDAWLHGRSVQPQIVFNETEAATFLKKIAADIDRPVQDATITVTGTNVVTTASQTGRQLDEAATLAQLRSVVLSMNTGAEIPLPITEAQPTIKDAEAAAAEIRLAVSGAIQIYMEAATSKDPGPWQASPDFIGGMLSVVRVDDGNNAAHYEVKVNTDPLKTFLQSLAPGLSIDPVNARFLFNETTNQLEVLEESVDGRSLDVDATLKAVEKVLFQKENRRAPLTFRLNTPVVNSKATAQQLGISQMVVQSTTFFYGSTAERKVNVQVAASRFHGLVIAPGEEFSFNKYLGDVSPETGYETGLVIYGNQTIKGVGGGVCQVSTTVFQAAFFAGLPIKERYAHGYRVGYYESGYAIVDGRKYNSGVGLDATVYSPIIDLKFVNDTPYYLLMESFFKPSDQSLTFKFFSTSTGRVVTKDGPTLSNPVPHGPTKYQESADLRPGQQRQVDYAVDGIDAHVYRTIKVGDQVIVNREDFFSHYLPWAAIFQVAPGYAPNSN